MTKKILFLLLIPFISFSQNIDELFSFHGYKNCFDERNFSLFRCRLSIFGIKILSDKLSEILFRINQTNKKVLLLDCDNTLWGGVVGEDGIEKIKLGQDGIGLAFLEFQIVLSPFLF